MILGFIFYNEKATKLFQLLTTSIGFEKKTDWSQPFIRFALHFNKADDSIVFVVQTSVPLPKKNTIFNYSI